MATFGPIASANPNVLFDPAAAIGAAQQQQRNQLLMENAREDRQFEIGERDHAEVARISAVLMGAPAEQRATLYPQMVTAAQQRGLLRSAPTAYPGDTVIAAKAQSTMTPAQILARQDLERDRVALGGMFGPAPGAAPASVPSAPSVPGGYTATLTGMENSTGNPNAKNPLSSATGDGQFINSTWLAYARANPDRFQGLNEQQILAKRGDRDESRRAVEWYAQENAPLLRAQGLPTGPGELALSHRFGPDGAIVLLRVEPGQRAEAVLSPEVMKANPDLRGKTVGQIVEGYRSKFAGVGAPGGVAGRTGGTDMAGPGVPAAGSGIVLNPPGTPDWAQGTTAEDQVRLRALAQARGMTREKLIDEASKMAQANRLQQRWEQAHPPASPDAGPFTGNGIEPQVNNTLLRIGPKIANGTATDAERQQYALAHGHLARGTVQLVDDGKGGQVLARIPGVVPPSFPAPDFKPGGSGSAPAAGGGGAAGQGAAQPIPGASKSAPLVTPAGREAVRKIEMDVTKADEAIANFLRVHAQVGGGGVSTYFNNPRAPGAQRLLGAFEAMKAALRTEAFLNTGVLQPAEAKMLDDTLLSPQSARGALASREALEARLGEIRETLRRGVAAARKSAGMESEAPAPGGGGGGNIPPAPPGFTVYQ